MSLPNDLADNPGDCGQLSDTSAVICRARELFRRSGFGELSTVICEFESRRQVLTLRGRASSYFIKQVAQEIVLRIEQIENVVNLLEVAETPREDRTDRDARRPT